MLQKPRYSQDVLDRVEQSRCPKCGRTVFIPLIGWQKNAGASPKDPLVFCSDMGHWTGFLSQTVHLEEPCRE